MHKENRFMLIQSLVALTCGTTLHHTREYMAEEIAHLIMTRKPRREKED